MSQRLVLWRVAVKVLIVLALLKLICLVLDEFILAPHIASKVQKEEVKEIKPLPMLSSHPTTLSEVFESRLRAVDRMCNLYKSGTHPIQAKTPQEIFRFSELGLKWCPVYKGGSTNMISTLCPKYFTSDTCSSTMSAELLRHDPQHRFNQQIYPTFPTLLIVRDPFERLMSCYFDKIVHDKKQSFNAVRLHILSLYRSIMSEVVPFKDVLLWNGVYEKKEKKIGKHHGVHNPYLTVPTFPEFIMYVTSGHSNDHWMPIFHSCQPCFYRYDYIIKLEHFDEEFSTFIEEKALDIAYTPYSKKKVSSRSKAIELFSTLSENQLGAFYAIFKGDCELFEYDCEGTMRKIRSQREIRRSTINLEDGFVPQINL